jgi:tetratricopeptide (TPR) repeat protein
MLLRKPSLEGFALAAFFLICIPYLQLVPYAPPSLVSDRFLSLAAWALIILIVALVWHLKPLLRTILLMFITVLWGFQTIERPRDWRNFETLIDADLRSYPGYYMPATYKITSFQLPRGEFQQAIMLANGIKNPEVRSIMNGVIKAHLGNGNEAAEAGKLQGAIVQLWKLGQDIKRWPEQARLDTPLNNLWTRLPYILAVEWKNLVQQFPDDVSLRYNAGIWMLDARRYIDAVSYLRSATESQLLPSHLRGKAYTSLGMALLESGQIAEAEAPLRAALEQSPPELGAYCSLVKVYKQTGRYVEAAQAESACPVK